MISNTKVLTQYKPTVEDLKKASAFDCNSCPRRYCWWWKSLEFEWNISPKEGCTFLSTKKAAGWKHADTPCSRSESSSKIDHYESRNPHILEDKIDESLWVKDA